MCEGRKGVRIGKLCVSDRFAKEGRVVSWHDGTMDTRFFKRVKLKKREKQKAGENQKLGRQRVEKEREGREGIV